MFEGPTISTPHLYRSGVQVRPARHAYPPYDPPKMQILSASAIPSSMAHLTESVRSCCMVPTPHSPSPLCKKLFPHPVDPLKFICKVAYPRLANHCAWVLNPQKSLAQGPPCTNRIKGVFFSLSARVRYPTSSNPSLALTRISSIGANL